MDANPVGLIIIAIAALVVAIALIVTHLKDLEEAWDAVWPVLQKVFEAFWDYTKATAGTFIELIVAEIKASLDVLKGIWQATWDSCRIIIDTVWTVIKTIVSTDIATVRDIIDAIMDVLEGHWSAAWQKIKAAASEQLHQIVSVIKTIASGFIDLLYTAGRDLLQGLINGIKSMVGSVMNIVSGIGHDISSAFSSVLHIGSPSRVFYQHGVDTIQGYINAVLAMMPSLKSVMAQAASAMMPASPSLALPTYGVPAASATAPAYGPGVGGGSGAPSGNLVINVDGKQLMEIMQSQIYQYNIRNSGQVTGTVKPA